MNTDADEQYADIIHLPHPVSRRHPQMSMADRAAQFSPFAALDGHDAAIAEAARTTENKPLLDETVKQEISHMLQAAAGNPRRPLRIVYFKPDSRKSGGVCLETCACIRKLQPGDRLILMEDGTRIPVDDVLEASPIDWTLSG